MRECCLPSRGPYRVERREVWRGRAHSLPQLPGGAERGGHGLRENSHRRYFSTVLRQSMLHREKRARDSRTTRRFRRIAESMDVMCDQHSRLYKSIDRSIDLVFRRRSMDFTLIGRSFSREEEETTTKRDARRKGTQRIARGYYTTTRRSYHRVSSPPCPRF